MARCLSVVLAALIGAGLALPAAAQWKWRGPNGQIQYSDLPPPAGVPDKDILMRPTVAVVRSAPVAPAASAAAAPPLAPTGVDPALEAKRKQAEQAQADKVKADQERLAAMRADNCQRAHAHVRTLESGLRMARVDEKGEREIIDDAQRAAALQRARDTIATDCK